MGFVFGREVPFSDGQRNVPVVTQDLGEEAVLARDEAVVPGEPDREIGDAGHAVGVMVAAGEETCARR